VASCNDITKKFFEAKRLTFVTKGQSTGEIVIRKNKLLKRHLTAIKDLQLFQKCNWLCKLNLRYKVQNTLRACS